MNAGIEAALRTSREMLDACRMLFVSDDSILPLSIPVLHCALIVELTPIHTTMSPAPCLELMSLPNQCWKLAVP